MNNELSEPYFEDEEGMGRIVDALSHVGVIDQEHEVSVLECVVAESNAREFWQDWFAATGQPVNRDTAVLWRELVRDVWNDADKYRF